MVVVVGVVVVIMVVWVVVLVKLGELEDEEFIAGDNALKNMVKFIRKSY